MISSIAPVDSWAMASIATPVVAMAIATACAIGVLTPTGVTLFDLLNRLLSLICKSPDQDDVVHSAVTGAVRLANTGMGAESRSMDVATD
jgi:hypothetical protein